MTAVVNSLKKISRAVNHVECGFRYQFENIPIYQFVRCRCAAVVPAIRINHESLLARLPMEIRTMPLSARNHLVHLCPDKLTALRLHYNMILIMNIVEIKRISSRTYTPPIQWNINRCIFFSLVGAPKRHQQHNICINWHAWATCVIANTCKIVCKLSVIYLMRARSMMWRQRRPKTESERNGEA